MKRLTLGTRLALAFALLAFAVTASVGLLLYWRLEAQLVVRDDAALVTRVDQLRTLMQDTDAHELIREKPRLFANMLGNTESLLLVRYPDGTPLIEINPGHVSVPAMQPVSAGTPLTLAAVQHTRREDGTPFIYVAALAHGVSGQPEWQILSGRVLTERTVMLHAYRQQVLLWAAAGALLAALLAFLLARLGLSPLRRLAAETSSIGAGTLSTRIGLQDAPPELQPLILAFNEMLDRLERSFNQLKQLSADMAHDMRTPIANLLGQTEVGLRQVRDGDYYQRLLGSNYEELQRLSKMLDNMLFLARGEQAEAVIERAELSVEQEFGRLAEYFEDLADERGLRLAWQGEGRVLADPSLFTRAVANLLANALRYAEPGSTVLLAARQLAAATEISVENRGPVIEAHHLSRLFDRFYRADPARSGESSGLGLSIVRGIMVLHGGSWTAVSADGVTRFSLCFPRQNLSDTA